jgi:hypothetical protein
LNVRGDFLQLPHGTNNADVEIKYREIGIPKESPTQQQAVFRE